MYFDPGRNKQRKMSSQPPQYVVQGQPGAAGQPVMVPAGQQPVFVQPQIAPGSVMYYPGVQGGVGAVYMVPQTTEPKYKYTPNDFTILSLLTIIICGLFSPLTLAFSIPAYCFSRQSMKNSKIGAIALARKQGMIAAYLNIVAIVFAMIVAIVCTGLVIGLYGPDYALKQCIDKVRDDNGGVLPPPGRQRNGYFDSSFVGYC